MSTIGKISLNSNISSTCSHNMANLFGPLAAEICWRVWGTPANFKGVSRHRSVTARHSSSGRQPNFVALNKGRHLYSAGLPSRWALANILIIVIVIIYYYYYLWPPCITGCGHIYFHPLVPSSFFFFISSPNLSGQTLDVYHTSTHGVALVRI